MELQRLLQFSCSPLCSIRHNCEILESLPILYLHCTDYNSCINNFFAYMVNSEQNHDAGYMKLSKKFKEVLIELCID
jgi:hypothetical protein